MYNYFKLTWLNFLFMYINSKGKIARSNWASQCCLPANTGLGRTFPSPSRIQPSSEFLDPMGRKISLIKAMLGVSLIQENWLDQESQPSSSAIGLNEQKSIWVSTSPSRWESVSHWVFIPPFYLQAKKAKRISKKWKMPSKLVNLLDLADRQIGQLSGGWFNEGPWSPAAWSSRCRLFWMALCRGLTPTKTSYTSTKNLKKK